VRLRGPRRLLQHALLDVLHAAALQAAGAAPDGRLLRVTLWYEHTELQLLELLDAVIRFRVGAVGHLGHAAGKPCVFFELASIATPDDAISARRVLEDDMGLRFARLD